MMHLRGFHRASAAATRVFFTKRALSSCRPSSSFAMGSISSVFDNECSLPGRVRKHQSQFLQSLPSRHFVKSTVRPFSTSDSNNNVRELPVKILYATQGGTAQLFAMQLSEALEEVAPDNEVTMQGLNEEDPQKVLQPGKNLYVFLAATAGVGEPPDNARDFHKWLTQQVEENNGDAKQLEGLDFCVFALGNQKAHPNHYNVFGKGLDEKLDKLGATRIFKLGLGDDGDCLEDDYDIWMEEFLSAVYKGESEEASDEVIEHAPPSSATASDAVSSPPASVEDPSVALEACAGAKEGNGGKRLVSSKYGRLRLTPSGTDVSRDHLLHLDTSFYMENTKPLPVLSNRPLNPAAGDNGMHEMRVSIKQKGIQYETGDHLMVYPQNSQAMIEGILQQFDVDPHVMIEAPEPSTEGEEEGQKKRHLYPHPTGITLTETLRHCVDLGALPSPNVARTLLGRSNIDFKKEIAVPRRTILELLADDSSPRKFALEEILYNLPPMRPRYYSIASSALKHPEEMYLVYRPVQYTTNKGHLRTGVCTSYMTNMMGTIDAELDDFDTSKYHHSAATPSSHLIAAVNSNPTFRLPADRKTPVLFIAGGCGVAPIRAFLEERVHTATGPFGEGYLFMGFRSPADAPYKALVQQAFKCGGISNVHLTYNAGCGEGVTDEMLGNTDVRAHTSCGLVSDALGEHGEQLYSFFERGGHAYICGGARLFGVAIENQVHLLLQKHGGMSEVQATKYLQDMLADGRFNEDLSD